jgi:hypothetical protein
MGFLAALSVEFGVGEAKRVSDESSLLILVTLRIASSGRS